MSPTRRLDGPVHVFEDERTSHIPGSDIETALLRALGPLNDASNKANVQLNPSTTTRPGSSPSKRNSSPLRPVNSQNLSDFRLAPPRQPSFHTDSPQKNSGFYSIYQQRAPRPEQSLSSHSSFPPADKENQAVDPSLSLATFHPYPPINHAQKPANKRAHMDAPQLPQPAKKLKLDLSEPFDLPDPHELPAVVDDGQKPPQSYAELIGMAILRSPNRRLTLAQIYKWITDHFAFYRTADGGWQNSIRHNLSLNKNFIKQERPKDDPGKGNYWVIKPGEERPFLLGKKQPMRRIIHPDGSQYSSLSMHPSSDPASFRVASTPAVGNFALGSTIRKAESKGIDSARFPDETEISSDGTIPASDPALQEEGQDVDTAAMPPPPPALMRSSPPPQDLGSSPPTIDSHPHGTPPLDVRAPSSSRLGNKRRKFAALNDSGYWSSIESSATRGATRQLASEPEIRGHRIKKGRAEAEIARIRSSSFDSPSKDISQRHRVAAGASSSPPHRDDNPLTPVVIFKRPARPELSISPNTNLQDHRNAVRALIGSPIKGGSPLPSTWSPAFMLNEEVPTGLTPLISPHKQSKTPWRPLLGTTTTLDYQATPLDIFIDAPEEDIAARGSPEKRESRRPSFVRAATSAGILADITGTAKGNSPMLTTASGSPFSLSPFLARSGPMSSPHRLGSPLKRPYQQQGADGTDRKLEWQDARVGGENNLPAHDDVAELFGVDFHSDASEEGIDIFQDFGKIGQPTRSMPQPDRSTGSPVRKTTSMGPPPRPAVGRSATRRW